MGRGIGPTQQKVLDYLHQRWANPTDPTFIGVPQAAVAAALATTHSEAQAIRRAIRTLKDRKVVGTAYLLNDFDCWLVPVGENCRSLDPRPKAEGKMATLRDAITAELPSAGWKRVDEIRDAVLGPRPATPLDGAWDWDRRRQLFNRTIKQVVTQGIAVTVGGTNKKDQGSWQIRRCTETDHAFRKKFQGKG